MEEDIVLNEQNLVRLALMRMPFGRYKGELLVDLPEAYLVWFSRKGFPAGVLGDMLKCMYEIKANGLEYLIEPILKRKTKYHTL